jgi:hypothetical protein
MSLANKVDYSYYNQVNPESDLQGSAFTRGQINFKWNNEGHTRLNPSRSYFRVRINLSNATNTGPILDTQNIAPNMWLVDNMFQQMRMRINGTVVSSCDDYVPQIAALNRRIISSKSRLDTLGKSLDLSHANFYDRQNVILGNGIKTENQYHISLQPVMASEDDGILINEFDVATQVTISIAVGGPPDIDAYLTFTAIPNGKSVSDIFSVGEWLHITAVAETYGRVSSIDDTLGRVYIGDPIVALQAVNAGAVGRSVRKVPQAPYPAKRDRQTRSLELIWKPCLGFWNIDDWVCGRFHFEITPVILSTLKNYVIESIGALTVDPATFHFEVESMLLYGYTGYTSTAISGTKQYQTHECFMQSQNLTTDSLTNKNFSVNPRTFALSLAFAQGDSGADTRYSRTKFKMQNDEELSLTRFYIQYKGVMLPRVIPDPSYLPSANKSHIAQNYYEMLHYSGAIDKPDCEDIDTWKQRGTYYHFNWPLNDNPSTEVAVSTQFAFKTPNPIATLKPQVMLFHHYLNSFSVTVSDGVVTSVK